MAVISMKALLESGVHFGHRTNKWDPRMKPYIFTERNGIHIIDLQQTVKLLNSAFAVIRDSVIDGGVVLFVGTKRQAQETISEEAIRAGMPYVTERWLGGMLTNWSTMSQRIQELERLEGLRDSGEINKLTKKEGLLIEREITRLQSRLEGVRKMKRLPDLVFIVDVFREEAAVRECNLLNIPIVALVDTNCNPNAIDYVIPSNDDAIRAIKLLVGKVTDAILEGKAMRKDEDAGEAAAPVAAAPLRKPSKQEVVMDDEISDADLLGEATLAKMATSAEAEAAPVVEEVATKAPKAEKAPKVEKTEKVEKAEKAPKVTKAKVAKEEPLEPASDDAPAEETAE